MASNDILYSKGKNDECMTPAYGVKPILKYIPENAVVWCPFDKQDSEFVKQIKANGNKVISSHIHDGEDFYNFEPQEHWDCIVSNPPFTAKRHIFERALSFNKPFALIMSNTWLNDAAPVQIFKDKGLQLLMFTKRMQFLSPDNKDMGRPTFSSSYFCYKFLPKDIVLEDL
jgi:hypothetical protein